MSAGLDETLDNGSLEIPADARATDMGPLSPLEIRARVQSLLERARSLIETHGWVQGCMGGEGRGFCALSALDAAGWRDRVWDFDSFHEARQALFKSIRVTWSSNFGLVNWNDQAGRTKQEVLDAFKAAIELMRAPPTADDADV